MARKAKQANSKKTVETEQKATRVRIKIMGPTGKIRLAWREVT